MGNSRHNLMSVLISAPLLVAVTTLSSGCESQQVGATSGATAIRETRPSIPGASPTKPAKSSQPSPPARGAKTVALDRAGDRQYDKTFDDIRFDIQPGQPFHREMLPEAIETLAGRRIRIRGFILPTAQKRGIKQFVLVRDNQECCFGPGAALYDCILVEMQQGASAEYSIRPVAVDGIFSIDEVKSGDMHLAIYRLDAESVR